MGPMAVQVDNMHQMMQSHFQSWSLSTATISASATWICPSPSEFFTGRRSLIEELKPKVVKLGHTLVLAGPGGAGKTQIALKTAEGISSRYAYEYIKVCYLC